MDNKTAIIDALETLRIRDLQSSDKFSALAYTKAIKELKKLNTINFPSKELFHLTYTERNNLL